MGLNDKVRPATQSFRSALRCVQTPFMTQASPEEQQRQLKVAGDKVYGRRPAEDCLSCRIVGAATFGFLGIGALVEARRRQVIPGRGWHGALLRMAGYGASATPRWLVAQIRTGFIGLSAYRAYR